MTVDLDILDQLAADAEAVSPSPWHSCGCVDPDHGPADICYVVRDADGNKLKLHGERPVPRFVRMADPAAVRWLVGRAKRANELERYVEMAPGSPHPVFTTGQMCDWMMAAKGRVEALEAVLAPFVALARKIDSDARRSLTPDTIAVELDWTSTASPTIGDLRRLRAVVEAT